jgi:microcystin-dependent protein
MSQPFIGEIRMVGFNFLPAGWALCDGQLLPIAEYEALFALIGTTYGGDGLTTFAVPDLRSRSPMHIGQGPGLTQRGLGEAGGSESVSVTIRELPAHSHQLVGSQAPARENFPMSKVTGESRRKVYGDQPRFTPMSAEVVSMAGAGQPHDNTAPFQVVNFVISLFGIFPSQG